MKGIILFAGLFVIIVSGCSQSRNTQKGYAFFQHITYGTIATDEKGNQLTPGSKTEGYIYLETKVNSKPTIAEIIYNRAVIKNPTVTAIKEKQVNVGFRASDNKQITLVPAKGNKLWKIEFVVPEKPAGNGVVTANEKKVAPSVEITIQGRMDSRVFKLTLKNAVELRAFNGL